MSTSSTALFKTTLTRHEEISPGVFVIGFIRKHDFIPGQAIKLGIDDLNPPRIYSICSGNQEHELCVLFNIKDDGFLTPKLAKMCAGDTVYASAPYGTFCGTEHPAWWIATGTGIAPFRSMLASGMGGNKKLVHGVRHLNQFYYEDELRRGLGENYFRCCSSMAADGIQSGRVTPFLEQRTDFSKDWKYYICGQATMAVETRDLLISKGIPFAHIITEIYF
ncbi:MAG: FAD-dependent oxidoreductase [Pontiella sp.]